MCASHFNHLVLYLKENPVKAYSNSYPYCFGYHSHRLWWNCTHQVKCRHLGIAWYRLKRRLWVTASDWVVKSPKLSIVNIHYSQQNVPVLLTIAVQTGIFLCNVGWLQHGLAHNPLSIGDGLHLPGQCYNGYIVCLSHSFKLSAELTVFNSFSNWDRWKTLTTTSSTSSPKGGGNQLFCHWSEQGLFITHDYCGVIWHGNECWLYPFLLKTEATC